MPRRASGAALLRAMVRAMRPHQWLKNLLLFVPMAGAHRFDLPIVIKSMLAFLAFSLVASAVYVLNDLFDLEADRQHPRKRARPFASGALPLAAGWWLTLVPLVIGFGIATGLGWSFFAAMVGYLAITTAYSFKIKRVLVLDVCTLALLYTIRILAGSAATGVPITFWLLAFSIFLFFALAAVKRQAELADGVARGVVGATGRSYHVDDLPIVAQMASSAGHVSILVMALYITSDAVARLYSRPEALWGICLILLFWLNRMTLVANRGEMHDDPVVFAAVDRTSQLCIGLAALVVLGAGLL